MKKPDTPMKEQDIRSYIANNLNRIEKGLTLLKEEYQLLNEYGAKGKIDILCKDRFGCFVVIEIKKNDATARQAIHELYKYTALLRRNHNINAGNIRCILLSTHWHELIIPFSSFAESVEYLVEGYDIEIVEKDDLEMLFTKVGIVKYEDRIKIFPEHISFLYISEIDRDNASSSLENALNTLNIENSCILYMNYMGEDPSVVTPYALYLVIDYITESERYKVIEMLSESIEEIEELIEEEEENLENYLLGEIHLYHKSYSVETGFAENFHMLLASWDVKKIVRRGRFERSKDLLSDKDIINLFKGFEGDNSIIYKQYLNVKIKNKWKEMIDNISNCLYGNEKWSKAIYWFLKKIEDTKKDADIIIEIYNPMNIIMSLYTTLKYEDPDYMPNYTILVISNDGVETLNGTILWDSNIRDIDFNSIMIDVFGDPFSYFLNVTLKNTYQYENEIINKLGLEYCNFYGIMNKDNVWQNYQLIEKECEMMQLNINDNNKSIIDLFMCNEDLYRDLNDFFVYNTNF